jgi:hypothetical protein
LVTIFGSARGLGKVYVKMDVGKMLSDDEEGIAFMYLVERVDLYLRTQESPGMLIGDRENETVAGKFAEKLSHRTDGTQYELDSNSSACWIPCISRTPITAECCSWPTCTHG